MDALRLRRDHETYALFLWASSAARNHKVCIRPASKIPTGPIRLKLKILTKRGPSSGMWMDRQTVQIEIQAVGGTLTRKSTDGGVFHVLFELF